MTKAEIISQISEKTGIDKSDVSTVVEAYHKTVSESLTRNEEVIFRGFGTYRNKLRKPKVARNIAAGTQINIPARYQPTFDASKDLESKVESIPVKS